MTEKKRFWEAEKRKAGREAIRLDTSAPPEVADRYGEAFTASRVTMAREDADRLEAAFDDLPPDYRQVLVLSCFVKLDHEQVATAMERTVPAVKNLLLRARARLAVLLHQRGMRPSTG